MSPFRAEIPTTALNEKDGSGHYQNSRTRIQDADDSLPQQSDPQPADDEPTVQKHEKKFFLKEFLLVLETVLYIGFDIFKIPLLMILEYLFYVEVKITSWEGEEWKDNWLGRYRSENFRLKSNRIKVARTWNPPQNNFRFFSSNFFST